MHSNNKNYKLNIYFYYYKPGVLLLDAIKEDFEKTRKCNLRLARNIFLNLGTSFALQKHSSYTNTINQGYVHDFKSLIHIMRDSRRI